MATVTTTAVFALEATAGPKSVEESQTGLSTKIDAINAATTTVINKILNCSKTGQTYNSLTDACIGMTTTEQTAMLNCQKNGQTYNQATNACISAGKPVINYASCTTISNYSAYTSWAYCPNGTVMTGVLQQGLATGAKVWFGAFRCCPFK